MASKKALPGRPAAKQRRIVMDLRDKIVRGKIPPAGRLPTRRELVAQYRASLPTVQLALDDLITRGFVRSKGVHGTFVSDTPPHLCRYALVFPHLPTGRDPWPRFWTALSNEALAISRAHGRQVPVFYGVNGDDDSEDYHRLLDEVANHTLAGIIFAWPPEILVRTPLLTADVPRVAIMAPGRAIDDLVAVSVDGQSFMDKSLAYLKERGRRRIARLAVPIGDGVEQCRQFEAQLSAMGMTTRPVWQQYAMPEATAPCVRHLIHLLMSSSEEDRPDGLIVQDDNHVEAATAGLVAAGVGVPDDLDVVAHCNFPWPTSSVLPVKRLGYDARELLEACLTAIDAQRKGNKPTPAPVAARFENEAGEYAAPISRGAFA